MKPASSPKRILIYRLGSLGDTIVALPAFHQIRRTFPDAEITVLTNSPVSGKAAPLESILEHTGLADHFIHYPVGTRNIRDLAPLRATIRQSRFDLLISLAAARGLLCSIRDYLFFRACGIGKLTGIPFQRRDLQCLPIHGTDLYEMECRRLLRRISRFGPVNPANSSWWELKLQPAELQRADNLLAEAAVAPPYIAVSLGTKIPAKDWGSQNWGRLLSQINSAFPRVGIVLLGSEDEYTRSQECIAGWSGPNTNLCGKTSPRVSAAILARAALFIGHDSGPMHLAASTGTPCIALFAVNDPPGRWFPFGPGHTILRPKIPFDPLRTHDPAYQSRAISSIGVDEVLFAVKQHMQSRTNPATPFRDQGGKDEIATDRIERAGPDVSHP